MAFSPYEKVYHVKHKKDGYMCKSCGSTKIANRFHSLCYECNFERMHGETVAESQKKKAKKLPFFSEKGKARAAAVAETKNKVRQDAHDNNAYFCNGCGSAKALDCSHNIALSQSNEHAPDYDNLVLLCRVCHAKYESNDPELMNELLCLDTILEYLSLNSPEKYYKKMYKLNRL